MEVVRVKFKTRSSSEGGEGGREVAVGRTRPSFERT